MQSFTWQQFIWYALLLLALLLGTILTLSRSQGDAIASAAHAQSAQPAISMDANYELAVTLSTSVLQRGQQSAINATLRNSDGQLMAGELVVFYGGLGTVTPASAVTDAEGRVSATYTAGSRGGQAQVTVLAGYTARSIPVQIASTGGQPGGYRLFLPQVAR